MVQRHRVGEQRGSPNANRSRARPYTKERLLVGVLDEVRAAPFWAMKTTLRAAWLLRAKRLKLNELASGPTLELADQPLVK